MNVLLFHPDKPTLEMIGFCLEAQIGLTVHLAPSYQEAIDFFLDDTRIDLVVTSQQPETDKLFRYLLSTSATVPVIVISEKGDDKFDAYPDIKVIGLLKRAEVPEKLVQMVLSSFENVAHGEAESEYCRIKADLLVRVAPLSGDVFVRLSSVKFVKLFRAGMRFTLEDLERTLNRKKIQYLYVKKSAAADFVDKFKIDLAEIVANAQAGDEALFDTVGEIQEVIQELSTRMGFTKEVQQVAQQNIQLAIKAIGSSPKLSKVLASSQLRSKNYISSHSVMLANISCSVAGLMQWPSHTTFQKLVMASLFHDFFFTDPELAKINTRKQLEDLKLKPTDELFVAIKNHPVKCAELVKTFNEVPGDVDVIVAQHHERPDGNGFPKGIRAHQIAPLAAVMIVAHDMLDALEAEGEHFDMKIFLRHTEPDYQGTAFRKIWKALSAVEDERAGGNPAA